MNLGIGLGLAFRPVIGGASGPAAKTYADFQAHIATLATNGVKPWSGSNWFAVEVNRAYRTTAAAASGFLYGSSWTTWFATDNSGNVCRAVQHGLPSEAEFDAQVAAGREIFIQTGAIAPSTDLTGIARNGYTSLSDFGANPLQITNLLYWDGTQAQQMNPSTGTGPTPYTIP